MSTWLEKVPWFVAAPVVVLSAAGLAMAVQWFGGPYFERSFLDEAGFVFENVTPDDTAEPTSEQTAAPTDPAAPEGTATVAPAQARLLWSGEFEDGAPGHNGSGQALVAQTEAGALVLRVENFSVTNGPDLFVYLTTEPDGSAAASGLNLGELKATDGNFNYDIPPGTDLAKYRSVVIWCRSFDVNFAFATLEAAE